MGYENPTRSSSGTVTAIILLLVSLVIGGLFVLGAGSWFFLRTSRMERMMMAEREQAIRAEQVARAMAERAAEVARNQADLARQAVAESEQEIVGATVPGPQISVELDKEGHLKLDGDTVEFPALRNRLKPLTDSNTKAITVNLRAAEDCPFQHVAAVISACQELGISRFRIRILQPPAVEPASDVEEPATVVR